MLKEHTARQFAIQGRECRIFGFCVDGNEVVPLYDTPHLLKGVRNNMFDGDVTFCWKKKQTASWKHIVQLYELDVGDFDTKMLNRLTDFHIYKDQIKKMKVKNAAQVFSQRVSENMRALIRLGAKGLAEEASDTADFLLFMDKLFDSMNGSSVTPIEGKLLRCAVCD